MGVNIRTSQDFLQLPFSFIFNHISNQIWAEKLSLSEKNTFFCSFYSKTFFLMSRIGEIFIPCYRLDDLAWKTVVDCIYKLILSQ